MRETSLWVRVFWTWTFWVILARCNGGVRASLSRKWFMFLWAGVGKNGGSGYGLASRITGAARFLWQVIYGKSLPPMDINNIGSLKNNKAAFFKFRRCPPIPYLENPCVIFFTVYGVLALNKYLLYYCNWPETLKHFLLYLKISWVELNIINQSNS